MTFNGLKHATLGSCVDLARGEGHRQTGWNGRQLQSYCKDEYTDYVVYRELAKREPDQERRGILEQLSQKELGHYEFWKKRVGEYRPRVNPVYLRGVIILRFLFGLTFTIKLLERHEEKTIAEYRSYLQSAQPEERAELEVMIRDEEEHEHYFVSQINEGVVRYMSFIVLGLADAIVEITGVHAGFLGVTNSTLIAGIAGLVVGFAAAISMASAAYLQAKHDVARSPTVSAIATGVAYISAVSGLAMPYFFTRNMPYAFGSSIAVAVVLIAAFTFYGAVLSGRVFKREFFLTVGLTLGTALGTFLFGEMVGGFFGVRGYF
jgi:VIT1/CCC1 family predicted Fe2+/Mn2+ transporter